MNSNRFFKQQKKYKVNPFYLHYFIEEFWFIPSDILQRGMEANIWSKCIFTSPILDIGIGNGKLTNFLFKDHPQIDVGIDIEESGLAAARELEMSKNKKRYKKVMWANAEKMPFKDATFRTIISNSTFEHIDKDFKALAESARVLKKNGLLFLTVPSYNLQKWISEYEQAKNGTKALVNVKKFNERTQHYHYRKLSEWQKQAEKNNLELVFHKYYFPKSIALYWYKLFCFYTSKINKREVWSMLGDSKITRLLPKKLIKTVLERKILKNAYENGFFIESGEGAQLFMIFKKV